MMKKFFLPIFAALALTGCSEDTPEPGNDSPANSGGHFLAVNIVSQGGGTASRAGETGSNATNDIYTPTGGAGQYEDGTMEENAVNGVRLYFFTATGDAVNIKKNSSTNYYDIPTGQIESQTDPSEDHDQTVEKILKAVVIVEPGERLPAKVVAVINPILEGADALGSTSLSLSELQARCLNYANYAKKGQFVMTNSIYADANGLVDATVISATNYATSAEAALANPVEIYVERTVAKVRMSVAGLEADKITAPDGKTFLYKLFRKSDNKQLTVAEKAPETQSGGTGSVQANGYIQKEVYLKLDGWDVTADVSHAWFFKNINTTWISSYLGTDIVWNDPTHHRSYWADICNPSSATNVNQYYAYNDADHFASKKFDGIEGVYCNENGERTGESKLLPTQVLIKGTICDANGKPYVISEYGGNRFIDTDSLDGLKNRYIEMMKGMKAELPWRAVTENGTTKYVQLTEADIRMIAVEYINPTDLNDKATSEKAANGLTYTVDPGRYYVYPCLTDVAKNYTWYSKVRYKQGSTTEYEVNPADIETPAQINKDLLQLTHAKVWKGGKTYYFVNIQHLGDKAGGNWGTIRNHIYDINLTKIYGLGTPVYGEELVIIPEKPVDDQTYISARVNILSWRVVAQDVILDWD